MKNFKTEIKRSIFNTGMFICLLIAIIYNFVVMNNYYRLSIYKRFIEPWYVRPIISNGGLYSGTLYSWTFFRATPYYVYFMFILPMLAVLPYGSRLFFERRTGQLKNQLLRQSRGSYAIKKFISIYVSGGVAVTLPVFISLMVTYAVWPYHKTSPVSSVLAFPGWFKKLYFSHTWAFILIVLFAWFIYGGLLVSISIITSLMFDNLLTIFASPLFIYLIISYIERDYSYKINGSKVGDILPRQFLNPFNGNTMPGLGVMLLISLVNFGIYVLSFRRQDVF